MDRTGLLEEIVGKKDGCRFLHNVPIPQVTVDSIVKNRKTCATNVCKCYDTSWTCPPNCGSEQFCIDRINSYKDADIYARTFSNVDFSDKEQLDSMMNGFRQECRDIMIECRKRGYDMFALADGPCSYCKRCAVKDGKPCYHPEMQVPSVSGYGIDMKSYLAPLGEEFTFEKDSVTLYGVLLFR